jgi:hypothetical protein
MKNNNIVPRLRHIVSVWLMLAVFISSSMFVFAAPENKALAGEITFSGVSDKSAVLLNGERAYSGRTFFSSGVIATPETNSALVNLGKLGRINIAPNSQLSLSFAENTISGKLSAGQITVFSNEGVAVNIETSDNVVNNNAAQSSVFTVNVRTGVTQANAETGSITMKNGQPQKKDDDDDDDDNSILVPVLIYSGIVGAALVYTFTRDGDDLQFITSPVR